MSERLRVRRYGRTFVGVVAVAALAGLIVASAGSAANRPALSGNDGFFEPAWTPLGVSGAAQTLMVQLAGDPVTVTEANSGGKLSHAEKQALKAQLKSQQDGLKGSIEGLGGKILGDYQLAYNGIKVLISPAKAAQLGQLPGVQAIHTIETMEPDNVRGVPYIGAPAAWGGVPGLTGDHIKIAVIDTGIDYTHANFDGPGTVAAYNTANANDTAAADPLLFGPLAPRVKGGTDLVGDAYNASAGDPAPGDPDLRIPHPDPNPLDCNGHGSHVAGTAAGSGVLADGSTYTGGYNANTISSNSWRIAPGVAPEAWIYSVRAFGCTGSTNVTVDAIEWAVANGMDVINMSLGSPFGRADDPSAEASTNAAKDGVIVVTSSGNSGPSPYITGSPGTAEGAISTAAQDAWEGFPGATLTVTPTIDGSPFSLINANGYEFSGPIDGTIVVLQNDMATTTDEAGYIGSRDESLGCSPRAYTSNGVTPGGHQIGVARRGTCARVAKAIFGQQAGAAAVIMTNNANSFPPFEGQITSNPDTGEVYTVTIPLLGAFGNQGSASSPGAKLRANGNGKAGNIVQSALIPNPNFRGFASFTSGGPRVGDSFLKPDVTAPGVSIFSTANGTGNAATVISGTSMASPHNAGAAALVRQAKPDWSVADIKAAIVNTADPALADNAGTHFLISRGGTGTIQPAKSTKTDVIAYSNGGSKFDVAVSFGLEELHHDFTKTRAIKVENHGSSAATFNVAAAMPQGSPHTASLNTSSVTVPAGGSETVQLTLTVPAATAGASNEGGLSFHEVAGLVTFTPATALDNRNIALRVPYYLVPRAMSKVDAKVAPGTKLAPGKTATINLTNKDDAPLSGDADFYAWGLSDKEETHGKKSSPADIRAVGVQSFDVSGVDLDDTGPRPAEPVGTQLINFAVNMWNAWSHPSYVEETDILVDVNGDGEDDYVIAGADHGLVTADSSDGIFAVFVFSTHSDRVVASFFAPTAPSDSATMALPILSSNLCFGDDPATEAVDPEPCLSSTNPRFTYHAEAIGRDDFGDEAEGTAKYNPWSPSITVGAFDTLDPGDSATENVSINAAEWAQTPALGSMIVTLDNKNGKEEATLIEAKKK